MSLYRLSASVVLCIGLAGVPGLSWAAAFPAPKVVKLNARVSVLLGPVQHANPQNQGYMINSTVIVGDKGVVLVDPGGTGEVGRFLKQQVRKISRKPITHVINTHAHGDHHLANIAFPGATIVSSAQCRESVLQTGEDWLRLMEGMVGRKFPSTKPVAAGLTYPANSKTQVNFNGVRMIIWVPPGAHTDGDLMIYLPDDKILIAGDILVSGVVPTMQDGVVKNWISVLEELQAIDANIYVPGHGPLMNLDQVRQLHASINRFYAGVQTGYLKNLSEQDIREQLDLTEWERLERAYVIGRNINRVYLEIENTHF